MASFRANELGLKPKFTVYSLQHFFFNVYRKLYVSQIIGIVNLTKMKFLLRGSLGRQTSIWLIKKNAANQKAMRRITKDYVRYQSTNIFPRHESHSVGRFTPLDYLGKCNLSYVN